MIELPDWLTTTLAADATMDRPLPIREGQLMAGYATTVAVAAGGDLD